MSLVQSSSTSNMEKSSAMAKVRSRSDQRSPSSSAREPTTAAAVTRLSAFANRRTWSQTRSRSFGLNMLLVADDQIRPGLIDKELAIVEIVFDLGRDGANPPLQRAGL